jgi:hypothetical protein
LRQYQGGYEKNKVSGKRLMRVKAYAVKILYCVCFLRYTFLRFDMIDEKTIDGLREYIKDHYIAHIPSIAGVRGIGIGIVNTSAVSFRAASEEAAEYIKARKTSDDFAHALDRKRKEQGLTPAQLYKRANIDRRQYSRFMGPEGRHPSMNTVICFGLALRLSREEFDELLRTAGYALSRSSSRDVCIMYCLEKGIYDSSDVNALLFAVGISPLARE